MALLGALGAVRSSSRREVRIRFRCSAFGASHRVTVNRESKVQRAAAQPAPSATVKRSSVPVRQSQATLLVATVATQPPPIEHGRMALQFYRRIRCIPSASHPRYLPPPQCRPNVGQLRPAYHLPPTFHSNAAFNRSPNSPPLVLIRRGTSALPAHPHNVGENAAMRRDELLESGSPASCTGRAPGTPSLRPQTAGGSRRRRNESKACWVVTCLKVSRS